MCSAPSVPPVPPPAVNINRCTKSLISIIQNSASISSDACLWASDYPDLREACARYGICTDESPFKYKYKYFESISQVGPTCGLVALSMLMHNKISAGDLLNISKIENFTCNGEMFSCKNMMKLTEKAFSLAKISQIHCSLNKGGLFSSDIITRLLDGAVLLVPYDADCNHSPCKRKGHTAHWALVCGIIILKDPGDDLGVDPENVLVLCKHGKSKYLALWSLSELDNSNKNLLEFSPKKGADGLTYVLPEGGIGGENGLCDQFLIFEFL